MTFLLMLPFLILALATDNGFSSFVFGMLLVLLFLSSYVGAIITIVVLAVALLYWLSNE